MKKVLSMSKISLSFIFCKKDRDINIDLFQKIKENSSVSTEEFSWLNLYSEYSEGLRCCFIILLISYIYYKYLRAGWFRKISINILIKNKQVLITLLIIFLNLCSFGILYEIIINLHQLSLDAIINWCIVSIISIIDAMLSIYNNQFTLTMDILIDSNINEYILSKDNKYIDEKLRNSFYNNLNDSDALEERKLNNNNIESTEVQSSSSQDNISQDNENSSEVIQSDINDSNNNKSDQSNQMQNNQVQADEIRSENDNYNEDSLEENRSETPDSGYHSARRSYSAEDWARDYRRLDDLRRTKADKYSELERIQNNLTDDMKRFGRDEDTEDFIKDLETEKHNIVSEVQGLEREMEDARQVYWQLKKAEDRAAEEARAAANALEEYEINNDEED